MAVREELRAKLRYEQTVPCGLAHRRALGEVFVADSVEAGDDEYLLAIQVPRAHSLWFDRRAPYHDPFATAEAARQSAFVVVHRYVELPEGLPFSLQGFSFRVTDLDAYRDDQKTPLEGVLRIRVTERSGGEEVGRLSFEGDLEIGRSSAMSLGGEIVFLPKSDYESLRELQRARREGEPGSRPDTPARVDPELVGRLDERNVVIGEPDGEGLFPIVMDATHPSFFDHAYDHVPGPLIAEAWRQASIVAANRDGALTSPVVAATGCEAAFSDFAELDAPVACSADVAESTAEGRVSLDVGLHQFGNRLASGRIELTPYP